MVAARQASLGCAAPASPQRPTRRLSPLAVGTALGIACALAGGTSSGQTWTVVPSISLQETLSNNVNLVPNEFAESDLVTQITPAVSFTERGARTTLTGTLAADALLYARTGAQNNYIYPTANVVGTVEAIDKFFYVEGAAFVSQQFLNPFGSQPADLSNATQNRYTASTYRISPYLQGVTEQNVNYQLRNNTYWTTLSGTPIDLNNSFTTEWLGKFDSPMAPLGWSGDFDLTSVKFNNQASQKTNLGRVGPRYFYDPQLQFNATIGYEDNQFPLSSYRGYIYGLGLQWHPTERTNVVANWEHRYFGASYLFTFDHRTPLSVWSINASRNTTTYPQQLASLPAGNVALILNQLFASRIPDPIQRLNAIETLIQSQGLPVNLQNPVNLYTQQILLAENVSATVGLLGARNGIYLTMFYLHQVPIAGSGELLPPILANASLNNNTQKGVNLVWTHNLTPSLTSNLTLTTLQTTANSSLDARTNQGSVNITFTTPLSARTTVFAGGRYQVFRPNFAQDYNEAAVFAGLTYVFK